MKHFNYYVFINCFFLIFVISCSENEKDFAKVEELNQSISEDAKLENIDLSISNILIYPNQLDKNSMYIDIELFSENAGEGEVQISLLNDGKLVASNSLMIFRDRSNYSQSFLISENINFEKNFKFEISALKGEKNIANNRLIFESSLKIEKPKIAILSGKLNFNTPHILSLIHI